MYNAFGLAYSQIHGNRQALIDATLAKRMQPAFSASAGLQSAFLAANGITAAHKIINGDFGIPVLYTNGRLEEKHLTNGLGEFEQTMNISIKPYPSCRCSHAVIDAVLDLQKKHDIKWEEIEKGLIYLPPNSMAQIGQPFAVRVNPTVDAQFSAQYTAALTFIKGRPSIADFEAESVRSRQDILQLLRQFTTVEFEKDTAEIGIAEIELTMKNGSVLHTRINATKGSPSNPLTEEEQVQKFFDCMDNSGRSYSTQEKEKVLEITRNIVCYDDVTEYVRSLQEIAGQAHF
jgi:2-methylcitrate dehydratase PrpD